MIMLTRKEILQTLPFDKGESCMEWLETNGLGGYSGSTICGCNTRRYHGLLVAATAPPAERMVLLSKLDETLITGNNRYPLGCNNYNDTISPAGYEFLTGFSKNIFPSFIYTAGGITLTKTIAMMHGENTVVVWYDVLDATAPFTLELQPLMALRGYHTLEQANDYVKRHYNFADSVFTAQLYDNTPTIFIQAPGATFTNAPNWYYNFTYTAEKARGLDYSEDLFSHGHFAVSLKQGDKLGIIISTENTNGKDAALLMEQETQRRQALLQHMPANDDIRMLTLAADQFIVKRGNDDKTIIAGYPWFTDWARDTMIALPGLCLATGRFSDAKNILACFARTVNMGMLPNRFMDNGQPPEYNNVDGTLWYFIAIYRYLLATGDKSFVLDELLPVLEDIVSWHFKGTRYNIHVAIDGLLYAGETGQQLTWMDARVGNWVVTPRMGKPVEVQALWYNALQILAALQQQANRQADSDKTGGFAAKAKQSFIKQFWFNEGNYLYDVIDENGEPDASVRPNQLFAVSLPFALLEGAQAEAVLAIVTRHLYTSVGLRSLAPNDARYVSLYGGTPYARDAAYHQGTVWSWLIGPYADALLKVKKDTQAAKEIANRFMRELKPLCIGSVPEIFNADAPHLPKGCVAQAWGVGEVLRTLIGGIE